MLSTIIYIIALVLISTMYCISYRRACKRHKALIGSYMNHHEKQVNWWVKRSEDFEKERDELTVKLCEAEMWCEVGYPDEGERVLVCSVTKKGEKRINIAYYENGSWHGNGNLDNVIAWKYLPKMSDKEGGM